MRRLPFAAAGTLALAILLAGALVGGTPAPAPQPTTSPTAAAAPTATPTAPPSAPVLPGQPIVVWLARDMLPPLAIRATSPMRETTPEARIAARFTTLSQLQQREVPAGAGNALEVSRTKPTVRRVRVEGDVAHVDWNVPNGDWDVGGTAGQFGLLQQLVYTATEEPGIRRVMLTENGGRPTTPMAGHGPPLDKPLAREDVSSYTFRGDAEPTIAGDGEQVARTVVGTKVSNEEIPGLGRFTVEVSGRATPRLRAQLRREESDSGKWALRLDIPDAAAPNPKIPFERFTPGPIRSIDSPHMRGPTDIGAIFLLGLDDARPWRVTVEHTDAGTTRVNVDVGGRPRWVSRAIAVDALHPDPQGRQVVVQGAARAFEANVSWRKRDATGRLLASGNTTASLGTSAVWGTFRFTLEGQGPASCPNPGRIEVFWVSPRDGAEQDVVSIPASIC